MTINIFQNIKHPLEIYGWAESVDEYNAFAKWFNENIHTKDGVKKLILIDLDEEDEFFRRVFPSHPDRLSFISKLTSEDQILAIKLIWC